MATDKQYQLKLINDPASLNQAVAGIQRVESEFKSLQKEMDQIAGAAKTAGKSIPRAFDDKEIKRTERAINQAEKAMLGYGDAARRASEQVESFGDFESQVNTLRGALDTAGIGGPVGQGLQFVAEAAASVEALGRLGPALGDVAQKTTGAVPALGALASGIGQAVPGLSASGASLAALGVAGIGVGIAIGAAAIAFRGISKEAEETAKQIRAQIEAQRAYYQLLADGQLTTENAASELERNTRLIELNQQALAETNADIARAERKKAGGGIFASAQGELRDVLIGDPFGLDELTRRRDELEASTFQLVETNKRLTEATEDGTTAAQDAAAVEERLANARITFAQAQANVELQLLAARDQSSESIIKQISTLNAQIEILERQRLATQNAGGDVSALSLRIREMTDVANGLQNEILPLVDAQEAQTAVLQEQKEMTERAKEAAEKLRDGLQEVAQKALDLQLDLANATGKYNDDIEAIQTASYEKLAALQQKYNDSLIKASETLVKDQAKISQALSDAIAELGQDAARAARDAQQDYTQERIDEITEFNRAEQQSAKEHLRRLNQIREDAQQEEEDAVVNRDFRRLFEIRRNTTRQLEAANEEYSIERQERQVALNERLTDLAAAFAQEQAERQRDYQQQLQEAREQAAKERMETQAAYDQQIADLRQQNQEERDLIRQEKDDKIALRNQAIQEELEVIKAGQAARLEEERRFQQKLLQQAQQILSGSGGLAGTTGMVSQNGGGSMAGIGTTIANTTSNNNSASMTNNFQVSNPNPTTAANQIRNVVVGLFEEILN